MDCCYLTLNLAINYPLSFSFAPAQRDSPICIYLPISHFLYLVFTSSFSFTTVVCAAAFRSGTGGEAHQWPQIRWQRAADLLPGIFLVVYCTSLHGCDYVVSFWLEESNIHLSSAYNFFLSNIFSAHRHFSPYLIIIFSFLQVYVKMFQAGQKSFPKAMTMLDATAGKE